MLLVPRRLYALYAAHLKLRDIAASQHAEYKKWLRYFLDFCDKYSPPASKSERIRLFCEKLREKRQTEAQRGRAAHAISLYFEMQQEESAKTDGVGYPEEGMAENVVLRVNESAGEWLPSSLGSS
jgi:hypothetical protein